MKVVPEHNRKDIVLPNPFLERQGVHVGDKTRRLGSKMIGRGSATEGGGGWGVGERGQQGQFALGLLCNHQKESQKPQSM